MLAALQEIVGVLVSSLREGCSSDQIDYEAQFEPMLRELGSLHEQCLASLNELKALANSQPTDEDIKQWVQNRPVRQGEVIHLVETLVRMQKDRKLRSRISPLARVFLDSVCDYLGFPVLSSRYTFTRSLIRFETWLSFGTPSAGALAACAAEMAQDLRIGWDEVVHAYAKLKGGAVAGACEASAG